ncbi:MAG: DoxX family protein [Bacteroidota bacterium]
MFNVSEKPSILNIVVWMTQSILAMVFLLAGSVKIFLPIKELAIQMDFVKYVPVFLTRFIGIMEVLGGLGLMIPSMFEIKPLLTPLAAIGLMVDMVLAVIFHVSRGEFSTIGFNILLAVVAVFVAWARYKKVPITSH